MNNHPPIPESTKELREKYEYSIKNKLSVYAGAFEKLLTRIDVLEAENKRLRKK